MITAFLRIARFILDHPIGRRRPVRSFARLFWWQTWSRLRRRPVVVSFAGGTRLSVRRGEAGVTSNIYVGLHECADMAFVAHLLRPGDLFGDIGSNAGSYTVLASGVAGARTVALEPSSGTRARLDANVALNGLGERVRTVEAAASRAPGRLRFTVGRDATNRVVDAGADAGPDATCEVEAVTLDALFADATPLAMKIDVEGHEAMALAGAADLLARPDLVAVLVELWEAEGDAAVARLEEAGFAPHIYDPFARGLAPASGVRKVGNTLFLRTAAVGEIGRRLKDAPGLRVHGLVL